MVLLFLWQASDVFLLLQSSLRAAPTVDAPVRLSLVNRGVVDRLGQSPRVPEMAVSCQLMLSCNVLQSGHLMSQVEQWRRPGQRTLLVARLPIQRLLQADCLGIGGQVDRFDWLLCEFFRHLDCHFLDAAFRDSAATHLDLGTLSCMTVIQVCSALETIRVPDLLANVHRLESARPHALDTVVAYLANNLTHLVQGHVLVAAAEGVIVSGNDSIGGTFQRALILHADCGLVDPRHLVLCYSVGQPSEVAVSVSHFKSSVL